MRLGVRVKMLIGFVAVALFTGALGVYTLYALGLLNAEQQALYVDDLGGIYLVGKYVDVTWEGRTALLDYLISDDATERRSLRERIKASDAELHGIVDEMNAAEALLDHKRAAAADVAAASQATHDVLRNMALSLSFAAITLGLLIGFLLSRKVARAARELASAASGPAHGSLDQRITFHSHDELGRIADAFRQMVAYQQDMAAAANAIAAGNLSQDIQPKAETDVLGIAFQRMTRSIRALLFEREQTESALFESDERRRLTLEATQDVIYDCDLRLADSIVWSPSTRAMFGYEPGEMGTTLEEWSKKIHPVFGAHYT
jgi:methyl-accepting chemotaxis protein